MHLPGTALYLEGTQCMYSSKAHTGALPAMQQKNLSAVNRRRPPFFLHLGPVALCVISVLLIGLMAILYLSQVSQAVAANQHLQQIHSEQTMLARQNQDLIDTIAYEQSPAYIASQAKHQGLVPVDTSKVWVIVAHNLQSIAKNTGGTQP